MSKKISIGASVVLMLLAALVTFQITYVGLSNKYKKELNSVIESENLFSKLSAVDSYYRSLYIGDIDEETLVDETIRGYVYGTGDKYAYYLDREQYAELVSDTNAEMQGIGVYVIYQNDVIEIISVMPDSPALEAGIEPGDLVVYVDGESIAEIGYNAAVSKLKGEAGTYAEFTVLRGEELIDYRIKRGYVNEQTVMSHVLDSDPTIGVVKILSFDLGTPGQFKEACQTLLDGGVKKLIFDVRYNPGGDLRSIVEILDYLLPEGPIVRITDKDGNVTETYSSDANELDVPMCVLTNGSTASAAELFTSALKDYDKATVVGTNTYGKGTVQTIIPLSDGTGLGISYRLYCPPFSDNYEGVGIAPDVEVELDKSLEGKNIYKITDSEDNQLQKAVEILNK